MVDKYTYSVCPFKEAHQKEGHASTRLGAWAGWEADGRVMAFTQGQVCWSGPARSIRVMPQALLSLAWRPGAP